MLAFAIAPPIDPTERFKLGAPPRGVIGVLQTACQFRTIGKKF
jgi:hypothetical protein